MLEAAILDGDGVLVDSERAFHLAVNEALKPYCIRIGKEEYIRRWMINQSGMKGVVADYKLNERGVTAEELIDKRDEILWGYIDQGLIGTVAYAEKLVEMLYKMCPLGLATSDSERNAKRKLEGSGLWGKFKVRVTAEDAKKSKPDPEPYQLTADRLQAHPGNVVIIEDNPSGVISARGVKPEPCKVIAYPNGYTAGMADEMKSLGADRIVTSLENITEEMLCSLFP